MKRRIISVLGSVSLLIFISSSLTFSQESQETTERPGVVSDSQAEPDVQWIWGEAVSVGSQNKTVLVKYLDYETDQEKEITLGVDDKTIYENIKSIEAIQPKDVLSVDYIVSPEGKNIAKNISVEKPDNTEAAQEENITEEKKPSPPIIEESPQAVTTAQ